MASYFGSGGGSPEGYIEHGLIAIPLNSRGQVTESDIRRLSKASPVPSPIYQDGFLYMVKNGGLLTCARRSRRACISHANRRIGNSLRLASDCRWQALYSVGRYKITVVKLGSSRKIWRLMICRFHLRHTGSL